MNIFEVILRFGAVVLSSIAFAVMSATSETRSGAGSTFKMKFNDFHAYSYLVAVNFITFIYSSLQFIILGLSSSTSSKPFSSRPYGYICDQVLAILLFSASCSAATASDLAHHGLQNIWPPACSTWDLGIFCSKAEGAVVMSFFSSFMVISSSLFSGYQVPNP